MLSLSFKASQTDACAARLRSLALFVLRSPSCLGNHALGMLAWQPTHKSESEESEEVGMIS